MDNYFVMLNEKEKFPHHKVITYEALGKLAPDGSSVMIVCTDSTILKYKKGSAYAVGFAVGSSPVMASVLMLLSAPECTMRASSEVRSDNPHGAAGKAA